MIAREVIPVDIEILNAFDRYCLRLFGAFGKTRPGTKHTLAEVAILNEARLHPGTCTNRIAQFLGIDRGYATRIVKSLEGRGVIYRVPSAQDGRSKGIFLTDQGERLCTELIDRRTEFNRGLLEGLDEAQIAAVLASMQTIMGILSRNLPADLED